MTRHITDKTDAELDHEIRELNGQVFDVEWDMSNTYDDQPEKKEMRKVRRNLIRKLVPREHEQHYRKRIHRVESLPEFPRRISIDTKE